MAKEVIVALDFPDAEQTFGFLSLFKEQKPFVKIGMELFYALGPDAVREIKARGHRVFLADPHQLHADKHHAGAQGVKEQDPGRVGQAKPAAENRRGSREKGADVEQHGQSQQGKRQPGEHLFELPGKELPVKAFHKLGAVVVQGQLRDDKMENEIE